MKRETIVGSCIAVLAAVSVGQLYMDKTPKREAPPSAETAPPREPPKTAESKPVTVDEVVATYLEGFPEMSESARQVALSGLMDELAGSVYAKAPLSEESGTRAAKAALEALAGPAADAPFKRRLAHFIASRTRGDESRDYVFGLIDAGPADLRDAAVSGIGGPHGVSGKAAFAKVKEAGEKGLIAGEFLPGALRRTGGAKAVEQILAVMRSTDNWKTISACAVALQDYQDPALMGPVLERLEQTGMLEKAKMLPWISARVLSQHLEGADGSALKRGIKTMKARPSLVKAGLAAVKKGLESSDGETRQLSAEAVKLAVAAQVIEASQGDGLLAEQTAHGPEPVLKAEAKTQ